MKNNNKWMNGIDKILQKYDFHKNKDLADKKWFTVYGSILVLTDSCLWEVHCICIPQLNSRDKSRKYIHVAWNKGKSKQYYKGRSFIYKPPLSILLTSLYLLLVQWGRSELTMYGLLGALQLGTEFSDSGQVIQEVLFVLLCLPHGLLQVTHRSGQIGHL